MPSTNTLPFGTLPFGTLLKQLRKQAGMTQRDLAAALDYSDSFISSLEKAQRQPDMEAVIHRFIPALGLQHDPRTAAWLIECAAAARGEWSAQRVRPEENDEPNTHLPFIPIEFIGRAEEITSLCNRLFGHSGRLLTLVGPPGIGKTTLALAVAARLHRHFMAAAIDSAVGSNDASSKLPKARLIAYLRRKTMLVVLDNLEQINEAAPLVAELIAQCPGLTILATSRERLHLRSEQRFKVPPLTMPAAVALFVQRAQAIEADFALTPSNHPTIEAICEQLDCLPLALELCAAQIELFALAQLLAELQVHPLDLLVDGAQDLPPQQRTLRLAIGRSYELLDETERRLFRSLSVFAGGFAISAAAAVSNWAPEAQDRALLSTLHALVNKCLVRVEVTPTGEQRFRLLEMIREFALEQVRIHGEESWLRQRHHTAYLNLFRTGDTHLRQAAAATWFTRLQLEQNNC